MTVKKGLAGKLDKLYMEYKKAVLALPEKEREQWRNLSEFDALYSTLVGYIEYAADRCNFSYGGIVRDNAINMTLDDMLGLTGKKPLLNEFDAESEETEENVTDFSARCFGVVKKKLLHAEREEKRRILHQYSDNVKELQKLRKLSIQEITARNVSLEESDYYALVEESERIRANPEKVYLEQTFRENRIRLLKDMMDIVAKGPLMDYNPVYRNVGGAMGGYLSPVIAYEWQQTEWLKDANRRKECLVQAIAVAVAKEQARQTLQSLSERAEAEQEAAVAEELSGTEKTVSDAKPENSVREKLMCQMTKELQEKRQEEETKLRKNGVEENSQRVLWEIYYHELQLKYNSKTHVDAVTSPAWAWRVVEELTAKEAAWLFQHEMGICIPVLKFQWSESFHERMGALKNPAEQFDDVTKYGTFANWPKQLQEAVVERCNKEVLLSYEEVLEEIAAARKKLEEAYTNKKGGIGFESV